MIDLLAWWDLFSGSFVLLFVPYALMLLARN
jgi:hypothetical protein